MKNLICIVVVFLMNGTVLWAQAPVTPADSMKKAAYLRTELIMVDAVFDSLQYVFQDITVRSYGAFSWIKDAQGKLPDSLIVDSLTKIYMNLYEFVGFLDIMLDHRSAIAEQYLATVLWMDSYAAESGDPSLQSIADASWEVHDEFGTSHDQRTETLIQPLWEESVTFLETMYCIFYEC